eukprot:COSAG04_NODE_58_length_30339_cov_51.748578_11_plen_170_part_00
MKDDRRAGLRSHFARRGGAVAQGEGALHGPLRACGRVDSDRLQPLFARPGRPPVARDRADCAAWHAHGRRNGSIDWLYGYRLYHPFIPPSMASSVLLAGTDRDPVGLCAHRAMALLFRPQVALRPLRAVARPYVPTRPCGTARTGPPQPPSDQTPHPQHTRRPPPRILS